MTDQELKDLVASFAIDRKESSARFEREMQESREKHDRYMRESQEKFDRDIKEINEILNKVSKQMGGIDANQGFHAEQFFQDVFEKKLEFGGIKYDVMIPNLKHKDRDCEIEFDIALINGSSIALIEVKNRIHPKFVKDLAEDRIKMFREYFPKYKNFETYLGIAGFSFSEEVLHRASAYGIGIIKQVGDGVEISAENLRAY